MTSLLDLETTFNIQLVQLIDSNGTPIGSISMVDPLVEEPFLLQLKLRDLPQLSITFESIEEAYLAANEAYTSAQDDLPQEIPIFSHLIKHEASSGKATKCTVKVEE